MTWIDTTFHSDVFLTFGPRLALHQEGDALLLLPITAVGGGPWSLDRWLEKR
jgi:hypothetical protein